MHGSEVKVAHKEALSEVIIHVHGRYHHAEHEVERLYNGTLRRNEMKLTDHRTETHNFPVYVYQVHHH